MAVAQGLLPFKIEFVEKAESVTAHAGLPLLIEATLAVLPPKVFRSLRKALGYRSLTTVRRHLLSLVALIGAGGEHLSDLDTLRGDEGLHRLLGFKLSSPSQAKDFLYRFHQAQDGRLLTDEDDDLLTVRGKAQIRPEGPGLRALQRLVLRVVEAVQQRTEQTRATLDVDASIIEAHKKSALVAYEGTRGYQPQMAWWAEHRLWLCDQFRDGNVPAEFDAKAYLQHAFGLLPSTVTQRRLRSDSALYNEEALSWAGDEAHIDFAVSADMSQELLAKVTAIPEQAWHPYRSLNERAERTEERQWAEVTDFVPGWARNHKKEGTPFRYLAIRVRSRQQQLFEDEQALCWRHYAVVTNMDWNGERLLRWQREKQGTVEYGHGVVKNDLAGGVMPCGRFGSNAAWWRINLLVHNLLVLLEVEALPSELSRVRPKTLRFRLFNLPARIIHHARSCVLKLYRGLPFAEALVQARRRLVQLARRVRGSAAGTAGVSSRARAPS
jgi:hypothetical protein